MGCSGRSLQIVVNMETGVCYADVDAANPYQDVVNIVWHTGEVIAGWFRRKKKRKR